VGMPKVIKNSISLLAIAVTVLAALNVYGDFSEVEAMARTAAQADREAFLSQVSRNPLSQEYVFVVRGRNTITVTCARSAILLGEYSCKLRE